MAASRERASASKVGAARSAKKTARKTTKKTAKKTGKKTALKTHARKQLATRGRGSHRRKSGAGPNLPKQIISIEVRVVYCHKGQLKEMMLDTSKAGGITWDHGVHESQLPKQDEVDPGNRPPKKGGPLKLGKCDTSTGKKMKTLSLRTGGACCWWNGSRWICPDDFE